MFREKLTVDEAKRIIRELQNPWANEYYFPSVEIPSVESGACSGGCSLPQAPFFGERPLSDSTIQDSQPKTL